MLMMQHDASARLLQLITQIVLQGSGIGHSAMHWCAAKGYLECLQWLLKQGADINTLNAQDSTLLHAAAANGQESIVQYLLHQPETICEFTWDARALPMHKHASKGI